ncbi:MAG: hypothetical protein U0002_05815 [Thermoanaerobaculia bacterium]
MTPCEPPGADRYQQVLASVAAFCSRLEAGLQLHLREIQTLRCELLPLLPPSEWLSALWASEEATFPLALFDALEALAAHGLCPALAFARQAAAITPANPEGQKVCPEELWAEVEPLCPLLFAEAQQQPS